MTALTAQRYRIRRRTSQLRFLDSALLHPVCEVGRRRIVALYNELLGGPGCNQLIQNSIICWNYLYLTKKITLAKTEEERKRLLDIIETHSPQSWASFNMLGEFDFSDEKLQDTIGVLPPQKKADRNHPRKLGGAKSMIPMPFQKDIENPTADYVPLSRWGLTGSMLHIWVRQAN